MVGAFTHDGVEKIGRGLEEGSDGELPRIEALNAIVPQEEWRSPFCSIAKEGVPRRAFQSSGVDTYVEEVASLLDEERG